jgi:hypothetical protein
MSDKKVVKAVRMDEMSYGEMETLEEIIGMFPTSEEDFDRIPKAKLMIALAFISLRRDDPEVTLDDVRALPAGSIQMDTGDEADPTN